MSNTIKDKRIDTLDGFRFIAISSVILFHFFTRYSYANYYQKDPVLSEVFKYGYFGVSFFFMISGFVIFYTLEKTDRYSVFLFKRMARLFPPILLCSIITYILINLIDQKFELGEFHSTGKNFLPSLTFTSPAIWNFLFGSNDIRYINGSYWSLSVEVIFYLIAGAIYFYNKEQFVNNWLRLVLAFVLLNLGATAIIHFTHSHSLDFFPKIFEKLGFDFFTIGIFFYCLYFSKKVSKIGLAGFIMVMVYQLLLEENVMMKLIYLLTIGIFLLFVYKNHYLNFLKLKWITRIGVSSYTLYLIHEYLGVVLIHRLSAGVQNMWMIRFIIFGVIIAFIALAELVFVLYEQPVNNFLKKKISGVTRRRRPETTTPEPVASVIPEQQKKGIHS